MKMTLIPQAAVAVLLLVLTLCLQCAGVAALIGWLRSVTAKGAKFGPIRSAILVVKLTIAIIVLHGLVILLWASFYRRSVSAPGNSPCTSLRAVIPPWDTATWSCRVGGDF